MKIIHAIAAAFLASLGLAALGDAAEAQQTGRAPVPPAPRPGPGVPVTAEPDIAPPVSPAPQPRSETVRPSAVTAPPTRQSARPQQGSLQLEIATTRTEGRIAVAIYSDPEDFRKGEHPVRAMIVDRRGPITPVWVLQLPPGRYAVAVFQDVDGNGQLDKGAFGIPREPYGYSNDARGRFGPPNFEAAAFTLGATGMTQRITVRNPMNAILR